MSDFSLRWRLLAAVVLLALAAGAVALLVARAPRGEPLRLSTATPAPAARAAIKVYISGAVRQPGVYTLREGDRVQQALEAAGGATEEADLEALNLALRLQDEDHLRVPAKAAASATSTTQSTPGKVALNSASSAELEALPGIGPKTAQQILDFRNKNGPFKSIEDLLDNKLVNRSTFDKIKDLVSVE